jgi:hypothetical protein
MGYCLYSLRGNPQLVEIHKPTLSFSRVPNEYVASSATMSDEMPKIDVSEWIAQLEQVLRSANNPARCEEALTILQRWQFDEMLDEASREKARVLVREFARFPFRRQA